VVDPNDDSFDLGVIEASKTLVEETAKQVVLIALEPTHQKTILSSTRKIFVAG